MSDTPAASVMRWSATGADCANSIVNRPLAQVAPELLAEQRFDIRLIVNHENEQAHALSPPDLLEDVAASRQNDSKFSERAGSRIDLYRPASVA